MDRSDTKDEAAKAPFAKIIFRTGLVAHAQANLDWFDQFGDDERVKQLPAPRRELLMGLAWQAKTFLVRLCNKDYQVAAGLASAGAAPTKFVSDDYNASIILLSWFDLVVCHLLPGAFPLGDEQSTLLKRAQRRSPPDKFKLPTVWKGEDSNAKPILKVDAGGAVDAAGGSVEIERSNKRSKHFECLRDRGDKSSNHATVTTFSTNLFDVAAALMAKAVSTYIHLVAIRCSLSSNAFIPIVSGHVWREVKQPLLSFWVSKVSPVFYFRAAGGTPSPYMHAKYFYSVNAVAAEGPLAMLAATKLRAGSWSTTKAATVSLFGVLDDIRVFG